MTAAASKLGARALTAVGCGTAIATVCTIGLFQIEQLLGGLWSVAAVLLAGLCCAFLARVLGRLSTVVPSGAGLLAFFSRGFGRTSGLALAGPYLVLCLILIGAEALIVGILVARIAPVPPMVGAVVFLVGTFALCRLGLRVGYRAQAIATFALVACLGALALVALAHAGARGELAARLLPPPPSLARFVAAVGQALFLFMGFELLTSQVEVASSPKAVRRALGASVLVLASFYALVSLGFSCVDHAQISEAARYTPQLAFADQLGSRTAIVLVVLLSLLASFTSVNGALLALSRFLYALAAQRMLPRRLGRVDPRTLIAPDALLALLALALAATALVGWGGALEPAICAAAITASLVYAALAWVRERPPFRSAETPAWRRLASRALGLCFLGLGIAVFVDAGPARRGTIVLLVGVYGIVGLLVWRRQGATREA